MNEQRKAFEAWATSYEDAWNEYGMRRNADDEYEQDQVRMQWEGWQAAITSQAPRQALSDAEIRKIAQNYAARVFGAYDVKQYDCEEDFFNCVRAIEAASGPNAALVEAFRELIECMECEVTTKHPALTVARDALESAEKGVA